MAVPTTELQGEGRLCQADWDNAVPDTGGLEGSRQSDHSLLVVFLALFIHNTDLAVIVIQYDVLLPSFLQAVHNTLVHPLPI